MATQAILLFAVKEGKEREVEEQKWKGRL